MSERQLNERRETILRAVDTFLKVHAEFEADVHGPPYPDERFEKAIRVCIEICQRGDIPTECRGLIGAVARMGVEWILYENGKELTNHSPTRAFWDTVRGVMLARIGATPFKPKQRESVRVLRKQNVGDRQIAVMFADPEWPNGHGPFFGSRGEPNENAINAEVAANEKGETTIPADWVHPDDRDRKRRAETDALEQLTALENEISKNDSHEDPEKMLREGAFVQQVATCCGISTDEVYKLANRIGIQAAEVPNMAATRGVGEPAINPAADRTLQPRNAPELIVGESEMPHGADPAEQAADLEKLGYDAEQIAEHMGLTPRKVKKLLSQVAAR